jgi:chromosomal replication initiator protein
MQDVTDTQDRLSENHMLSELYQALAILLGPERYELWLGQLTAFLLECGTADSVQCGTANSLHHGSAASMEYGTVGRPELAKPADIPAGRFEGKDAMPEVVAGSDDSSKASDNWILYVACPTQFQLEWLRRRLHQPLQICCRQVWQREVNVVFHITPTAAGSQTIEESQSAVLAIAESTVSSTSGNALSELARPNDVESGDEQADSLSIGVAATVRSPGEQRTIHSGSARRPTRSLRTGAARATSSPPSPGQSVRPAQPMASSHWHFGTFVVGKANELAHNSAKIVAQQPGRYCPLLLYGPSGVGKTHLLSAIRHQVRTQSPRAYVVWMTSEQFTTQFLEALDRRGLPSFRQKHRTAHVLLIDDIQFFAGKRATLEELLYTIDSLHERGSQIVLTSDRSLGQLQSISPELTARISSGLSVPVDYPDYETRVGIVQQLALKMQIDLDDRVAVMIATRVAGSARQLSGALNRLLAGSMALGRPITPQLAESVLAEFAQQNAPPVRLADIQQAVCEVFGVEPSSLKSSRKSRNVTEPRMLAMWLARKYTRAALSEISDFFGRRSHSTVISAQKKVETLLHRHSQITVADTPCPMEEAIQRVESVLRSAS